MIYTVYHLPQLEKVGCTNNFERRMKEQDVEPLEEYIKFKGTLEEASFVEEELRKFYKYKPDSNMTYLEKVRKTKSEDKHANKVWMDSHFVGWNELPKGASKGDLSASIAQYDSIHLTTKGGSFVFTRDQYPELAKKAKKSQHRDFYWSTTNLEAIGTEVKDENIRSTDNNGSESIKEFEQIRQWAIERGLYEKGDPKTQYLKLQEEAGEVARAILKDDKPEIIDGLGDVLVVLINLSHLCGLRLEDCLAEAYSVISKRKGKMINGTFVKNN